VPKGFFLLQNPFQAERELDGLSKALVDIQQPLLYAGAAVFLAATAFLGSFVGTKAPGAYYCQMYRDSSSPDCK